MRGKLFNLQKKEVDIERNRRKEGGRNKIDRKIIIYNSLFSAWLSCSDYY